MPAKREVFAEIEDFRGRITPVGDTHSWILKPLTIMMLAEKLKDDD